MNKYKIFIHAYPFRYDVEAESEPEALDEAKRLFYEKTIGKSIYETEVELEEKNIKN